MNKINIHRLLENYRQGFSLEQPFYTHPGIFELEWKYIWKKYWLFAGTTAAIPRPGDYFVYKAYTESVIVIRNNDGAIYAHYNTCRHRGSLICLEEKGHAQKLICPYHQWVYNKDGSLSKARLMPDDFDKTAYGLQSVHVRVISGLIFISFAEEPPSFADVERDYTPFLDIFEIDKARVAYTKQYVLRTNWKLVAENFRECYHCGPAHPEYCSAVVGANLREETAGILAERTEAWQQKGLTTGNIDFTGQSFHFAVRYPLRPGVESYSTNGKAVALPMGLHTDYDAGVLGLVMLPGFWMDAVSDYMWTMRLTPVSPGETIVDLSWLVDGKAVEGKDYTIERLIEFWKITGEQDWKLCENNFAGIESGKYQPGPYAPVEADVAKFVDWYIDQLRDAQKF